MYADDPVCPDGNCGRPIPKGVGNPLLPEVRVKYQREVDYASANGLIRQVRVYRSDTQRSFQRQLPTFLDYSSGSSGAPLQGCFSGFVELLWGYTLSNGDPTQPYCFPHVSIGAQDYQWNDGEGRRVAFVSQVGSYLPSDNKQLRVLRQPASSNWLVVQEDNSYSVFSATGRLLSEHFVDGRFITYTNDASSSIVIADNFGRSARLTGVESGMVASFVDPAGGVFRYDNDRGLMCPGTGCARVLSVTYPDNTQRRYLWNEPELSSGGVMDSALTGLVDELGIRIGWYGYDSSGYAISTERGSGIDRYSITGMDGYAVYVQSPLGGSFRFGFRNILGSIYSTGITQPAGSGSASTATYRAFDAIGNLTESTGLDGKRSCFAYEPLRSLQTVKVEGLSSSICSQMVAVNATLPTDSRKISKQWHPDWRLATKTAEPGRITTIVYNGQPDPFNGGAVASCAPSTALLPDGKPIAVICKRVEQATTDTNGAAGFGATLQSGVANRITTWTYNAYGQVLTERDPLNNQTSYAYYADTSFTGTDPYAVGHTTGDLQTITNAKGQVTQFTQYDKHGNVLQSIDPNGVVTQNTYDLRQRLLSTTTAGQTTSYQYDAAGQLKRVTLPDQSWMGYDYDGAHRQVAVYDQQGNRIDYTLDNAGNRTAEQVKDPSGALKRQLTRSIDALGRVQQTTGRE